MSAKFVEAEGFTHLVSPIQGEYTVCGDAFDLGSDEPGYEWSETKKRIIDCPKCSQLILGCRGVRVKQS